MVEEPSPDPNPAGARPLGPEFFGLSQEYWGRLSPEDRALYQVVRPLGIKDGGTDIALSELPGYLDKIRVDCEKMGGSFELCPDFQRGHVWSDEQRSRYIEAVMRGNAPRRVLMNCPGWLGDGRPGDDIPQMTFQCVDGLQRVTAVQMYAGGELEVFGGRTISDFKGTPFAAQRFRMQMVVMEIGSRRDLLQMYLDLNAGGSVHSPQELQRVRELLAQEQGGDNDATQGGLRQRGPRA